MKIPNLRLLALCLFACLLGAAAPATQLGGQFDTPEERAAVTAAETALDNRNFEEAWELARDAVRQYPDSFEAIRTFVSASNSTNRLRSLAETFNLESTDPREKARAHYARGWLAVLLGNIPLAHEELVKARDLITPPDFEVRRALLVVERAMGTRKKEEILADYRQFVHEFHDVGLAHVSQLNGFNFLRVGDRAYQRAIREAYAAPEQSPQLFVTDARAREKDFWFDPQEGLSIIEKGLALYPHNSELGIRKIYFLRRLGRVAEALDYAREWTARAPNNGEFLRAEFELLIDLGRFDEALAVFDRMEEITFQPDITERVPYQRAETLHLAGRTEEAIDHLLAFVSENPSSPMAGPARQFLYALQTRTPTDRVKLVDFPHYLQQKGNYCGPATVSMILSHWGLPQGQDEVAASVYTGIAGTPPQVLRHFARSLGMDTVEFEGTDATWKELLDAGFPILWLQMNGADGGHYRIVTGYDDVLKRWFVHDPNNYSRTTMGYDQVEDTWVLPSLRRSIVIFPEERATDPLLASLGPTPILIVTNWVLYVATGANLFVGLFPALPLNLFVALLLGGLCAVLLRRVTFPVSALPLRPLALALAAPIILLNLVVLLLRWNGAVSALLAIHLALITLALLLLLIWLCQSLVHDMLNPRESLGLSALVVAGWLVLAFVDQAPWETLLPIALFIVGLPALLYPRLRIRRGETLAMEGQTEKALRILAPWGWQGRRYLSAVVAELDASLVSGRFDKVAKTVDAVLTSREPLPRWPRIALRLYRHYALALRFADEDLREEIVQLLREPRLPKGLRLAAEGLLLYVDSEIIDRGDGHVSEMKNNQEIDLLLTSLNGIGNKSFPGLPVRRTRAGRPIQSAAFLLALSGAMQLASAGQNRDRRRDLWIEWSGRYGLMLRLLRGFEERQHPRASNPQIPRPTNLQNHPEPKREAEQESKREEEKYPTATPG